MAFNRPTLTDLVKLGESELNALVSGADARIRFSMLNIFARIWAALADGLYSALNFLSKQFFATTATGEYLDEIGLTYGVSRAQSTASTGYVRVYGTVGTAIPTDTIFTAANGVQLRVVLGQVISSAFVDVQVISETTGLNTNLAGGTAVSTSSAIAGISKSEVSPDGVGGGSDTQTDDEYRASILRKIQNPCGAGTVTDWENWAYEFGSIVTRVWVIPLVYGNGTVGVVFAADNAGVIPSPATVAAMQSYLNTKAPAGSTVYAFAPTLKIVDFAINMQPDASASTQANVRENLESLFYSQAIPNGSIPLSQLNAAISNAYGEVDHIMSSPSATLTFAGTAPTFEIGSVGAITYS